MVLRLSRLPHSCRNASENPAGIETHLLLQSLRPAFRVATHQKTQQGLKQTTQAHDHYMPTRRNASENPAGIETFYIVDHMAW